MQQLCSQIVHLDICFDVFNNLALSTSIHIFIIADMDTHISQNLDAETYADRICLHPCIQKVMHATVTSINYL